MKKEKFNFKKFCIDLLEYLGQVSLFMLLLIIGFNALLNIHLSAFPIPDPAGSIWMGFIFFGALYGGFKK